MAPESLTGPGVFFEEMTMEEVTKLQMKLLMMLVVQDLRNQVMLTGDEGLIIEHADLEQDLVDLLERRYGRRFQLVATS